MTDATQDETAGKHTSGPWEVANWTTSYANEVPDWNAVSVVGGGMDYVLAIVIGDAPGLDAQANARLIAAVPDLLREAVNARNVLQYLLDHEGVSEHDRPALAVALGGVAAALAKARGDD